MTYFHSDRDISPRRSVEIMRSSKISLKKTTPFPLSAQKFAQLSKAHGISEDDIVTEFNAMRKQVRRDATK